VTVFQVSGLFGMAYAKAASVNTAMNGFRASGVFPINRDVYEESEFCPADVTETPYPNIIDRSLETTENAANVPSAASLLHSKDEAADFSPTENEAVPTGPSYIEDESVHFKDINMTVQEDAPTTSEDCASVSSLDGCRHDEDDANISIINSAKKSYVSVEEISPLPKRSFQTSSKRSRASKSTVLTSSPHKRAVMAAIKKRKQLPVKNRKTNKTKRSQKRNPSTFKSLLPMGKIIFVLCVVKS